MFFFGVLGDRIGEARNRVSGEVRKEKSSRDNIGGKYFKGGSVECPWLNVDVSLPIAAFGSGKDA